MAVALVYLQLTLKNKREKNNRLSLVLIKLDRRFPFGTVQLPRKRDSNVKSSSKLECTAEPNNDNQDFLHSTSASENSSNALVTTVVTGHAWRMKTIKLDKSE